MPVRVGSSPTLIDRNVGVLRFCKLRQSAHLSQTVSDSRQVAAVELTAGVCLLVFWP
jgi:hypothetical protein